MMKKIIFRNLKVKGLYGKNMMIRAFSDKESNNKVEPKKGFAYKQIQNKTEKMKEEL